MTHDEDAEICRVAAEVIVQLDERDAARRLMPQGEPMLDPDAGETMSKSIDSALRQAKKDLETDFLPALKALNPEVVSSPAFPGMPEVERYSDGEPSRTYLEPESDHPTPDDERERWEGRQPVVLAQQERNNAVREFADWVSHVLLRLSAVEPCESLAGQRVAYPIAPDLMKEIKDVARQAVEIRRIVK